MKKSPFILALTLTLISSAISAQVERKLHFTTGFKAGVQANTYQHTQFDLEGYSYNKKSLNTRIGYTISSFFKLSKGRPYIQAEGIFCIEKQNFSFETNSKNDIPIEYGIPRYRLTTYSIQAPLLFGYYFVDSHPYRMGIFTGPKAKFLFTSLSKQSFDNFDFQEAKEYLDPLTFNWKIGLEVNIANICFDFTYQIGLNNTSRYIYLPETGERFHFKRNVDSLGFSLGVFL